MVNFRGRRSLCVFLGASQAEQGMMRQREKEGGERERGREGERERGRERGNCVTLTCPLSRSVRFRIFVSFQLNFFPCFCQKKFFPWFFYSLYSTLIYSFGVLTSPVCLSSTFLISFFTFINNTCNIFLLEKFFFFFFFFFFHFFRMDISFVRGTTLHVFVCIRGVGIDKSVYYLPPS